MEEFSIIIPCYRQANYLPEAIESAMNQTIPCEIIVINDGSDDNTKEVAEKYPVKVVSQINRGLASARNTGIMWAKGTYILPLDSDDILQVNCVERMQQVFQETGADVVAPSLRCFGEAQEDVIIMAEPKLEDFRTANRIPYASAIRKEVLLECGGYQPKMTRGYEDYYLWFDLLSRGKKIVGIQEILFLYRTKAHSMWKEAKKHHKELMEQIYKDFPQLWPENV